MTEEEKRFHEEVAGRLFEMRDAAGMTQEKLAEKAGVQSNSIHRYEVADRKIGLYTAVKVADALNTTVERSTYTKLKRQILKEKQKMYSTSYHQKIKKCSFDR